MAEEARFQRNGPQAAATPLTVTALLDARMDEMYVQSFEFSGGQCRALGECELVRPEDFVPGAGVDFLAGNVFAVYAGRLPAAMGYLSS